MRRVVWAASLLIALAIAAAPDGFTCRAQTSAPQQGAVSAATNSAKVDLLFAPLSQGSTPGAAVMIIQNGNIVHAKGYGLARLDT